jgi:phage terminase large subunit-like protein
MAHLFVSLPDICGFATSAQPSFAQKRRVQGLYTFSTQMLLKPQGDEAQGFKREWLRYSNGTPSRTGLNVYLLVDPANSKRKKSDWTAAWVVGLGPDENYTILDVLRDKLNLAERAERLFELVSTRRPLLVAYEEYGLQADIQFIQHLQEERNYRFTIRPVGGTMGKADRIRRLLPLFEQGRIILPRTRRQPARDWQRRVRTKFPPVPSGGAKPLVPLSEVDETHRHQVVDGRF